MRDFTNCCAGWDSLTREIVFCRDYDLEVYLLIRTAISASKGGFAVRRAKGGRTEGQSRE